MFPKEASLSVLGVTVQSMDQREKELGDQTRDVQQRIESMAPDDQRAIGLRIELQRASQALEGLSLEITKIKLKALADGIVSLAADTRGFQRSTSDSIPILSGSNTEVGSESGRGVIPVSKVTPIGSTLVPETYIVAHASTSVWVWNPKDSKWDAELPTEESILSVQQVDGMIAVMTARKLWLFDPDEFQWSDPLVAAVEKIESFNLSAPILTAIEPQNS